MSVSDTITGGCRCGRVRVTAQGEPLRVGICHCLDCRKHHGAIFYAAAVFPRRHVSMSGCVTGHSGRCFCPACGSSVYAITENEVEIHLGALDDPNRFKPSYELWCIHREDWLPDFPGTKKYLRNMPTPPRT